MKKLFFALALTMSAVPAFAQYYNCQVAMVDRYNRIIQRFYAQRDYRTGMCREGLRRCNYEVRRRGVYGARCTEIRGW